MISGKEVLREMFFCFWWKNDIDTARVTLSLEFFVKYSTLSLSMCVLGFLVVKWFSGTCFVVDLQMVRWIFRQVAVAHRQTRFQVQVEQCHLADCGARYSRR